MALTLKYKVQQDREGDRLWITDLTGEYNVDTNPTGYGIAGVPNLDLKNLCLLGIIQRNASEGVEVLEFVNEPFIYNPNSTNDYQTVLEAVYKNDGWHTINLVALPVSADGNFDDQGNEILEGQNFYWTQYQAIYLKRRVGELSTKVTEYEKVLEQEGLITTQCEDFFLSSLSIFREEEYKEYRTIRKGVCMPEPAFDALRETTEDIISADLTFRSGLMVQAQDQVEVLLDEKNLD